MGLRGQFLAPVADLYRVSTHHRPVQEREGVTGCGRWGSLTWATEFRLDAKDAAFRRAFSSALRCGL